MAFTLCYLYRKELHTIDNLTSVIGVPQISKLTSSVSSVLEKAIILILSDVSEIFLWPSLSLSKKPLLYLSIDADQLSVIIHV